ncbi:MAG TPA: hypothetical protein H9830_07300 [Candidatus Agrococcus pullicola]|uniref:Uncharacterized protein n=1 Tax=Candidatus Agrococcus pullicola TaxID=2838429 RepID=A0A9D1YV65_9MICO|nr:hypothetical protein [Candidatus Agrococcus pullicola]
MTQRRSSLWIWVTLAAVVVLIALWLIVPPLVKGQLWVSHDRRVTIVDETLAVELRVPDRLAITRVSADTSGDGCSLVRYSFEQRLAIESYSTACELSGADRILNGRHGEYRTIDDVEDPRDVEEVATDLGSAKLFVQEYTECTNYCRDFEEPVAIIELDEPADASHPSLVLQAYKGDISRDELREILSTLRALDLEQ